MKIFHGATEKRVGSIRVLLFICDSNYIRCTVTKSQIVNVAVIIYNAAIIRVIIVLMTALPVLKK